MHVNFSTTPSGTGSQERTSFPSSSIILTSRLFHIQYRPCSRLLLFRIPLSVSATPHFSTCRVTHGISRPYQNQRCSTQHLLPTDGGYGDPAWNVSTHPLARRVTFRTCSQTSAILLCCNAEHRVTVGLQAGHLRLCKRASKAYKKSARACIFDTNEPKLPGNATRVYIPLQCVVLP